MRTLYLELHISSVNCKKDKKSLPHLLVATAVERLRAHVLVSLNLKGQLLGAVRGQLTKGGGSACVGEQCWQLSSRV